MRQTTGSGPTLGQSSRTIRGDMGAVDEAPTAEAADQAIIRTEGLTKVYAGADFTAVDHLDLNIQAGEIFGLLGPNGAGKTTTAGMLTTRVIPTPGARSSAASTSSPTLPSRSRCIGIVSQQNTLDRQLTVWENLYFHGRLFGIAAAESRRLADELLDRFQLTNGREASVYALSGGMAQRLMVARAILHRPAVLFLDEPTRASTRRAASRSGTSSASSTATAKRSCSPPTTWRRPTSSAIGSRSWTTARSSRSTPRPRSSSSRRRHGRHVKANRDGGALAVQLERDIDGVTGHGSIDGRRELHVDGADRLVPRVVAAADAGGLRRSSTCRSPSPRSRPSSST